MIVSVSHSFSRDVPIAFLSSLMAAHEITVQLARRRVDARNNTIGVPTLSSLEPSSTRLAMHRVHLGLIRSKLALRALKGVSSAVAGSAAIGRWETDWKARVKYTVFFGSAEFVAQMRKLLRGDRDQQTGSGEERLKHSFSRWAEY
jgi:hypothetical protein